LEEKNAKAQRCKDAKVVDLAQRSRLVGRKERKGAKVQRRKGRQSRAKIKKVSGDFPSPVAYALMAVHVPPSGLKPNSQKQALGLPLQKSAIITRQSSIKINRF
jgi:hypothetical protein